MPPTATTTERHPYIEGVHTRTGRDGRLYRLCRTCDDRANAGAHRGYRTTPVGSGEVRRQARTDHPFARGEAVRVDVAGRRLPLCAVCGLGSRSHRPEHRALPAEGPRQPRAERLAEPVYITRPWEVDMLALAIDRLLSMPADVVGWRVTVRLLDLRKTLAQDWPGLVPEVAPEPTPAPDAADPGRDQGRSPVLARVGQRPPSNPERAARRLRRKLHSPRVRGLFDDMLAADWQPRVAGSGHIVMVAPDGQARLTINDVTEGNPRGWLNLRAQARRLGFAVDDT